MASAQSNRRAVSDALLGLGSALKMTRPVPGGKGRRLGDALADAVAGAIQYRTGELQLSPDGEPLPALKPNYRRRKINEGFDPRILVRSGEMLGLHELRGQVDVTASEMTMTAGDTAEVKAKVHYAEEGLGTRPKRHFYEPGPEGEAAAAGLLGAALDEAVREALG